MNEMLDFEKVTTRGGDDGKACLYDGTRLWKDDLLFESLGDLDELNSFLGVFKASLGERVPAEPRVRDEIDSIQSVVIRLCAMIATPVSSAPYKNLDPVRQSDIDRLETLEAALLSRAEVPDTFVRPGANREAALADAARSICRRAERRVVACIRRCGLTHLGACRSYLNRLSDYLFVLARYLT